MRILSNLLTEGNMLVEASFVDKMRCPHVQSVRVISHFMKVCCLAIFICGWSSLGICQGLANTELTACQAIVGLTTPIKKQQSVDAMCRIELKDLLCLPGLILRKDQQGEIDL
ncbi:MAG: hypothetical protein VX589_21720, partial [Myxococcota bacterium]|nr:hypothetical protein [Myxococcota bacterium]